MILAFFTLGLLLVQYSDAVAASRLCRQLESQLASASRGGDGQSGRYNSAAKKQRRQLERARSQRDRAGCGFFGSGGRGCAALSATIGRMERNLSDLERPRGGGVARGERARILARLDANDCRNNRRNDAPRVAETWRPIESLRTTLARRDDLAGRETRSDDSRDGRRERRSDRSQGSSIVDQFFSGSVAERRSRERRDENQRVRRVVNQQSAERGSQTEGQDHSYPGANGVRTMCVRTCDGYFFPMSSSSTPDVFDRDQQACEVMCPGTEIKLFINPAPDAESEDMISVAGQPYTEMPTAFAYKSPGFVRAPACSCRAQTKNFSILAGDPNAQSSEPLEPEAEPLIGTPYARPDPASDPETLTNRETGFSQDTIARMLRSNPSAEADEGDKRVRVVGPVFLPDPEEAIDLRAPAQSQVQ